VNIPDIVQTTRDIFTLPVDCRTPVGDTNIPLPIMQPMMTVHPFKRVISALSLTPSSFTSIGTLEGN